MRDPDDNGSQNELRLSLRRELEQFAVLTPAVAELLERHQVVGKAAYTVNLILEEMITNLIKHPVGPTAGDLIKVALHVAPQLVTVHIEDDGPAFDPTEGPEAEQLDKPLEERRSGGMGLHLVRNMVDGIRYQRVDGKNRLEFLIQREL